MSDLNDMMVFRTVVEKGSFTGAANSIGLPKSNISRKVSRLEESLGVLLLERSTRSLRLSEIGEIYYQHCVRIHEEMTNASHCVDAMSAVPKGWLKVGASVAVGQTLLAPKLAQFYQEFSQVKVDLQLSNRRIDIIEEGFDLAIRVGPSPDSSLISRKLCSVDLHLYASHHYLQKNLDTNPILHADDLAKHACLFMSDSSNKQRWELFDQDKKHHVNFDAAFVCDDFSVIYQQVTNDMGIALLPDYMCEQALQEQKVKRVLNNLVGRSVDIYAIYASRKGVTPKLRALLDYLVEQFN
ncbi:MAG: LysR family transcriptional regulator [Bermanella sp.]